jgi:hypothetical protein
MNKIYKTLQPSKDVYIQFTEDEILEMGLQAGDKFDVEVLPNDDGVLFKKRQPLDLDLDDLDIETLKNLVKESIEKDISVNDVINEALKAFVEDYEQ